MSATAPDPRNGGVGPHIVEVVKTGERAWCGGPGFCVVCDQEQSAGSPQ